MCDQIISCFCGIYFLLFEVLFENLIGAFVIQANYIIAFVDLYELLSSVHSKRLSFILIYCMTA